jgi:hypothetical protein
VPWSLGGKNSNYKSELKKRHLKIDINIQSDEKEK